MHTTYDVLAYYVPADKRRKPIVRWIAAVASHTPLRSAPEEFEAKALETLPKGAAYLTATALVDRKDAAHAKLMKTVNYWAGYPGCPA